MTIPLRGAVRSVSIGLMLVLAFALWPAVQAQAGPLKVTGVTLKEAPSELQVSIVATGPVRYQTRDVQPSWIVVDVQGARLGMPAGELPLVKGLIRKVRVGQYMDDVVRVVVELAQPTKFHLTPASDNNAILVGIARDVTAQPAAGKAPAAQQASAVPALPPARAEMAQLPLPPATPAPTAPRPAQAPGPSAAGTISSQGLINLELRNANIVDVIAALAKLANVNVVTDSSVKGTITVRLINVTFEDALRLVLEPNGLAYATVGPNIIVATKDKLARPVLRQYQVANMQAAAFATQYLPLVGLKKEQAVVDDGTNSLLIVGTVEDQAKVADLLARVDSPAERSITRVIKINYIDPATFVDLMGARLPDTAKATKIDKVSNSIVLTASAGQMAIIDALLQQVDTALPQVMIEAMVVEVPNEVTHNLGVAWQVSTPFTMNISGTGVFPGNPVVSIFAPPLLATLNTLIQENKSKLLANPRLAVRDGETARMNIGDKIPFQVINAQGVPSVVILEAGVKLEVTPRINADNFVTIKMHPEVSSIKTAPAPNVPPTFATREADSSLTVKDGTPIVLAGLISKNEIRTTVKVPLLGDIPILGWLFKSVSTDKTDNEVIFVITPHILQKQGS